MAFVAVYPYWWSMEPMTSQCPSRTAFSCTRRPQSPNSCWWSPRCMLFVACKNECVMLYARQIICSLQRHISRRQQMRSLHWSRGRCDKTAIALGALLPRGMKLTNTIRKRSTLQAIFDRAKWSWFQWFPKEVLKSVKWKEKEYHLHVNVWRGHLILQLEKALSYSILPLETPEMLVMVRCEFTKNETLRMGEMGGHTKKIWSGAKVPKKENVEAS